MNGMEARLRRIIRKDTGKSLIVAVDHGMALGPMTGIVDIKTRITSYNVCYTKLLRDIFGIDTSALFHNDSFFLVKPGKVSH